MSDTYGYFTGIPERMSIAAERFERYARGADAMNPLRAIPAEFAGLLQRFFAERLLQQQNASPRTLVAYRDTFGLLPSDAERTTGKPPAKLALCDFDATLGLDFLAHLETERHNTVRRSARLAAVRAFAHDVALQRARQILALPMKRFERTMLGFLSREEVQALRAAPAAATWCGRRDMAMLALLYNTGARVAEVIGLRVADVTLAATSSVRLHGKGRRQRTVPWWKETAAQIRRWLKYAELRAEQPLIPHRNGMPMTRTNVADRLTLAVTAATKSCPQLAGRRISPHTWRHTTAMLFLQAGVDRTVIALCGATKAPLLRTLTLRRIWQ